MKKQTDKYETNPNKVKRLWTALSDGEAHNFDDVAEAVGNTNKNSPSFKNAVKFLVDGTGLVEKNSKTKTLQFHGSLLPFGKDNLLEANEEEAFSHSKSEDVHQLEEVYNTTRSFEQNDLQEECVVNITSI